MDFWATWCGPCLALAPSIEELAKDFDGKAVVGKLDVDKNPQIASQFGIRSIPTIIIFKDGKPVDKAVGALPKNQLAQKLENQLNA